MERESSAKAMAPIVAADIRTIATRISRRSAGEFFQMRTSARRARAGLERRRENQIKRVL